MSRVHHLCMSLKHSLTSNRILYHSTGFLNAGANITGKSIQQYLLQMEIIILTFMFHFNCAYSQHQLNQIQQLYKDCCLYFNNYYYQRLILIRKMNKLGCQIQAKIKQMSDMLDLVYKLPQEQREGYFRQLDKQKSSFIRIKSSLRESNMKQSQEKYNATLNTFNIFKKQLTSRIVDPDNRKAKTRANSPENNMVGMNQTTRNRRNSYNYRQEQFSSIKNSFANVTKENYRSENHDSLFQILVKKDQQLKQYKLKLRQLEAVYDKVNEQNHKIKKQFDDLRSSQYKYKRQSQIQVKRNAEIQYQVEQLKKILVRQQQQIKKLQASDRTNLDLLTKASHQMSVLNKQIQVSRDQISNLKQLVQAKSVECSVFGHLLQQKTYKFQKQYDRFTLQQADYLSQIKRLAPVGRQNQHLKHNLQILQKELSSLKHQFSIAQRELSKMQAQSYQHREQCSLQRVKSRNQVDGMREIIKSLQQSNSQKQQLIQLSERNIAEMTASLNQKQQILKNLEAQIKTKDFRIFQLCHDSQILSQKLNAIVNQNRQYDNKYQSKIQRTKEQLEKAQARLDKTLKINQENQLQMQKMRELLAKYEKQCVIYSHSYDKEEFVGNKKLFYLGKIKALKQFREIVCNQKAYSQYTIN